MDPIKVELPGLSVFVEFEFRHYPAPAYKVVDGVWRRRVITDETICFISTKLIDGALSRDFVGTAQCSIKDDYKFMTGIRTSLDRALLPLWYQYQDSAADGADFSTEDYFFPSFRKRFVSVLAALAAHERANRVPSFTQRHKAALAALRQIRDLAARGDHLPSLALQGIYNLTETVPGVVIKPRPEPVTS